jgi:hypothetical protein
MNATTILMLTDNRLCNDSTQHSHAKKRWSHTDADLHHIVKQCKCVVHVSG